MGHLLCSIFYHNDCKTCLMLSYSCIQGAVAFELWSMTDMVLFDNILITDDSKVADDWTRATWHIKRDAELAESAKNA